MREQLAESLDQRKTYRARVERYGSKRGYRGDVPTILLVDVRDAETGDVVADHLWLTVGKQIKALGLAAGDKVAFVARTTSYVKGYFGRRDDVYKPIERDYRLSYPTKFKRVEEGDDAK